MCDEPRLDLLVDVPVLLLPESSGDGSDPVDPSASRKARPES